MPCEIRRSGGRTVVLVGCLLFTFARLAAALPEDQVQSSRRVLASTDFALTGLAVKVEPAHQDIPRHIASLITTRLAGLEGSQGTPPLLNPDYRVRGELVGPSLRSPKVLESAIGAPLIIPPLALAGDHLVTNLRVVDTGVAGSPTVAEVIPDTCSISVIDQLLVSQVRVRELSYDEILASGIDVDQDSYSYYNFTLALATSSQAYEISIPIAMPKTPDDPPIAGLPQPGLQVGVKAPLPDVLPLLLEAEEPGGGGSPELEGNTVRIPGLIVFPGRIALLHQFFEAIVIVGNGAPGGTPLVVHSLRARVELPQAPNPLDNPLRVAEVQVGGAVEELELHGLGADGMYGTGDDSSRFVPGESGQAAFLLEGLKEGLHTVKFKLEGTLDGLPAGPVTVRGEASGAVRVRDASFAVSFTHPGVVRAGQEYDLGITLFNSGSRDILGAYADLSPARIIGADLVNPEPGNQQGFPTTLRPGESGTVTWRLKARVTGAVTASYTKVEGAQQAELQLVTGVGDRNVPLSPDSLILPDAVRYLPPPVVEASSAFLGQAWSIATAPSGSLPEGVLPVSRETVLSSAIDLGVAGLRVRFGEPLQVSLVTLLRDWLGEGQETPDAGFVEALCSTKTGFAWQDRVGEQLALALGSGTATAFHTTVAEGELARSRFLSVLVTSTESTPFVGARLIDPDGQSVGLTGPGARFGAVPVGAMLRLDWTSGGQARSRGAFLIASNPAVGAWTLELSAWAAGVVDISIWLPIDEDLYRHISFVGVSLAAGGTYRVRFNPYLSSTAVLEQCISGSCSPTGSSAGLDLIDEPAPKLVGVLQVGPSVLEAGDRYGRTIALLFSKPVTQQKAEDAASYSMGGGTLVGSNPPVTVGGPIGVLGAKLNFGNRFAFLKPSIPVGPFIQRTITLTGITDTRGLALSPPVSDEGIEMTVSPGGIPPGGYLTGRILNADGTPIPSARIEFFDWPCDSLAPVKIAETRSDTSGHYVFDYIVNGECSPVMMVATHPTTASRKHFSAAVLYHGQHLAMDFVFLARGAVQGVVTMAGQPVASAQVQVVSNSDPAAGQVVRSDSTGKYFAYDVPVGGVSVLGVGPEGQTNATGFGAGWIDGPGKTATVDIALQSISGSAQGKVLDAGGKLVARSLVIAETRIPGIKDPVVLGFCYTAADGAFQLSNLPLGTITIFTTDSVTRTRVAQQIQLTSQGPSVTGVILTFPGYGSVSGRVIDQAGHYLAFAEVRCGFTVVSSDPFGYYRLSMLSAGMQQVTATNPTTGLEGSVEVTVRAGQETTGADIVVSAAATIRGTISIVRSPGLPAVPLGGAEVSYDGYHIVQTNTQGAYVLSNVPPGRSFTLRFIDPSKRLGANQSVKLSPGETLIRNLTFHPAAVGGRVFQPDGQTGAVARVTVYALLPSLSKGYQYGLLTGDHPITTISGSDGSYLIGNLNLSGFRISAFNEFFPTPVGRIGTLPPDSVVTCNLTLVDTLAGQIKGRVFRPDGVTPVGEGIEVTLGGGHLADAMVRTDETGSYSFPEVFSTGAYNLTAIDPATGHSNRIRIAVERNKDCIADIHLLGRGSIQAKVIDGAGGAVESGTVTVTGSDYPNASVQIELSAGSGGFALFEDLPEGPYSVTASRQGLSGRVAAVVSLSGLTTVMVQLQPCGVISGRVLMPDGTTPVSLADVRLIIGGRTLGFTVSSDDPDGGTYVFPDVPVGDFKLEAYDNRSTRVGRTAGRITQHGETVTTDVVLVAIGTVRGQVTANNAPVDHAYVTLQSGEFGFFGTTLRATTDPAGNFSFPGIPAGKFTLSATHPASALTGYGEGILPGGAEPLPDKIINIALEYSAALDGTVYDHQGTQVAGAQVTVTIGSRVFRTVSRANGAFRLDYVPLGDATVRAQAPSGYDRGLTGPVTLSQPGSTVPVEVTFDGVGAVKGDALDGDGVTGLTLGTVALTNSEWSPAVVLASPVQAGKYEFQGVPAGPFTMRLTVPNRTAVGAANGTLQAAETLTIPLVLEPAGTVTGRVVRPDGTTPAVGADVTVRVIRPVGGTITVVAHTDAAGVYRADQVSLGTIEISVQHYETEGLALISGLSLTANGQVLDVPLLILDENPIGVQSVSPTNGSVGVSRSTVVTLTFTERAKVSTVNSATFKLLRGASQVGGAVTLSADGLVATLTPSSILADNSTFTVVVTTQVTDLVGRKLPTEFRSTFTTPDETPPVVVSVDPASGATQVALEKIIQVTCNEALDPQQSFAGVVRLFPEGHPEALVPLVITLSESGVIISAQPAALLAESTRYRIEVTAQKDLAGNIQSALYTSSFSTVDRTKPVIDSVSVEGKMLFTVTPYITVLYHDVGSGIDTTSLVLRLDGQDIKAGAWADLSQASYQVPYSTPLAVGPHSLEVQVSDLAGNQSDLKTVSFTVDDVPPQINRFTIAGWPVVDGMSLTVSRPVFSAWYSDQGGIDRNKTKLRLGPAGGATAEMPVQFSYSGTSFTYQPAADMAEGSYSVQLDVSDWAGNIRVIGPLTFTISLGAPQLTGFAPLAGSEHGGTTVVLSGTRLLGSEGEALSVSVGGNPAWVIATVLSSPDQVTVVTPPGAPGFASIQITTDRGTTVSPSAFLYEAESKTPFAVEPDTVLLWHLDDPNPWADVLVSSGPFDVSGSPSSESEPVTARFGYGRTGIIWSGDDDYGILDFGTSSFTIDCWFKTQAVSKTYLLAGKQVEISGYGLSLLPSGALQGWIQNETGAQWTVETPAGFSLADDQWHSASLVADRENHRLAVFVDGLETSVTPEPPGFGDIGNKSADYVAAGEEDYRDSSSGPRAFPGILDEIRFSSSAHAADRIQQVFLGRDGTLPFSVFSALPEIAMRAAETQITLHGYYLSQIEAAVIDGSGATYPAKLLASSATEARIEASLPASAALGPAHIEVRSSLGSVTLPIRTLDRERSLLRPEPDTLLLWHLDDPGDQAEIVADSGPLGIHAGFWWRSLPGLFGTALQNVGSDNKSLNLSTSSFTIEGWSKEGRATESWDEKFWSDIEQDHAWWLRTDDGRLYAGLKDTAGNSAELAVPPNRYDDSRREWTEASVTDGQWHFVALVVDRSAGEMRLYLDGVERAVGPLPAGFGPLAQGDDFIAYGLWDELRVSSSAHTAEKIWQDFSGEHPHAVTSVLPETIQTGPNAPATQTLVVEGFQLNDVAARVVQEDQPADVSLTPDRSYGRVSLATVPGPNLKLGPALLAISNPGFTDVTADLLVVSQAAFAVDSETLLLWRLDESQNGATVIEDSGPFKLNGSAASESIAVEGRFQGGRQLAAIESLPDEGWLQFGASSFSVDFWIKTLSVPDTYVFVARTNLENVADFDVSLLRSGGLKVRVFDTTRNLWEAETRFADYDGSAGWRSCVVDDDRWHSVSVVIDRSNSLLCIYVDGVLRRSAPAPANFGAVGSPSGKLKVGYYNGVSSFPSQFPGALDDIRISQTARSSDEIWQQFSGVGPSRVTRVFPAAIQRNHLAPAGITSEVSVEGYGLRGLTVRLTRSDEPVPGLQVDVSACSDRSARLLVTVLPQVSLGPATLVFESQGTEIARQTIEVIEPGPPAREPDTVALWHLDEVDNGAVRLADSGAFASHGTADADSGSSAGRFGNARTRANLQAADDFGSADFGVSSFTLECWMKTEPVTRGYILVGKTNTNGASPRYKMILLANGSLRAWLSDGPRQWQAEASPTFTDASGKKGVKPIADDQWHMVTMVVDRGVGLLKLYVDGLERASSSMPAGFTSPPTGYLLRAGLADPYEPGTGPQEFPGFLDEIRISSGAHTAEKVALDFQGHDSPAVTSVWPGAVARDTVEFPITLHGYGLSGGSVQVDDPAITINSAVSGAGKIEIALTIPAERPAGPARFTISDPAGRSCSADLMITAPEPFANPSPTDNEELVLWHLDETGSGAIPIVGSGDPIPTAISATASTASLPAAGRLGGGRTLANLAAGAGFGTLDPGSNSFSVDCWFKTRPVGRPYNLVGRSGVDAGSPEFALTILPSGALQANARDAGNRLWQAEMKATVYNQATGTWTTCIVDDEQWHLMTMVVDRTAAQLLLYVDGQLRASAAPPAGFTTLRNLNQRVRAGLRNVPLGGVVFPDSDQFPGVLDEIRMVRHARTAAEIRTDFGLLAQSPATTWSATVSRQAEDSRASERRAGSRGVALQPFSNSDESPGETSLLWHLDERANGPIMIVGSGDMVPNVIGGRASNSSIAEAGRFAGGRTNAGIIADPDLGALDFGASSFTLEFWLRTDPVFSTYTLVGRDGPFGEAKDFGVSLLPSGHLRAWLYDTSGIEWAAEPEFRVDDSAWRLVTLSVDREAGWLYLLIDEEVAAAVPCPAGFGALANQGQPFRAGHLDIRGPATFGGPPEFPGVLDEVRILNYARKPAEGTK